MYSFNSRVQHPIIVVDIQHQAAASDKEVTNKDGVVDRQMEEDKRETKTRESVCRQKVDLHIKYDNSDKL